MEPNNAEDFAFSIQGDGGLYSIQQYICYDRGSAQVTLDGEYTIEYLKLLVEFMEKSNSEF